MIWLFVIALFVMAGIAFFLLEWLLQGEGVLWVIGVILLVLAATTSIVWVETYYERWDER